MKTTTMVEVSKREKLTAKKKQMEAPPLSKLENAALCVSELTPLRPLVIMGLDRSKQGRGPLVAKSVAGTMVVVFGSAIYSAMEIRKRVKDTGMMNPTDEVLQAHRQLEASLIGKL
uniref:Uncharacterized protein n=1 Tax=Fagus sylvatica TaxID=28930 RepID=A0A2N9GBP4_FAGSY